MKRLLNKAAGSRIALGLGMLSLLVIGFYLGRAGRESGAMTGEHVHAEADTGEETVWTCSMHPQIKMPEPGQCPICFMDLIPLETGGAAGESELPRLTISESAAVLAAIRTAPAVRRGARTDIRLSGKIQPDETRVEIISARIAGRIDRLFVDYEGIAVSKGDHLARIYSPELVSLQKELLEAGKAARELSPDASALVRRSTERTLEAVKEKLRLLGFGDREVRATLERGETIEHMTLWASQQGIVLKKLIEEGAYVGEGSPLFHIADLSKLWVVLDAYESDLVWLRLGQNVEFSVEAWPGDLFTGVISFVDPVVDPRTRTVEVRVITDNADLRLKPEMFVRAVVHVEVGKSGGVRSGSLRGKWISPMHPQIVKDNPGTCDICGMPLVPAEELGYVTGGLESVDPILIPATAPLITGTRAVVYVEIPDTEQPTYEGREVKLGPRVGDHYIVKSGIAEGERVVVNGAFKIDGELQIRARPSMMSPRKDTSRTPAGHGAEKTAPGTERDIREGPPSAEFVSSLSPVYKAYFAVSVALAGDNPETALASMRKLRTAMGGVARPEGKRYDAWDGAAEQLREGLSHVEHLEAIADARELFEKLSRQVIMLQKHYGHEGDGMRYLAFCPMAFGNAGAYWLQRREQINNPYYGSQMLRCGEIRENLPARPHGSRSEQ